MVEDLNEGDQITITADLIPAWLTLVDNGDGTAMLSGTSTEIGEYEVALRASDGQLEAIQEFTINAVPVGIGEPEAELIRVYPNPANNNLCVDYTGRAQAVIYNVVGQVVGTHDLSKQTNMIYIETLESGVYMMRIVDGETSETYKFIKK